MLLNVDELQKTLYLTNALMILSGKELRSFNLPSLQALCLELDQERSRIYNNAAERDKVS